MRKKKRIANLYVHLIRFTRSCLQERRGREEKNKTTNQFIIFKEESEKSIEFDLAVVICLQHSAVISWNRLFYFVFSGNSKGKYKNVFKKTKKKTTTTNSDKLHSHFVFGHLSKFQLRKSTNDEFKMSQTTHFYHVNIFVIDLILS